MNLFTLLVAFICLLGSSSVAQTQMQGQPKAVIMNGFKPEEGQSVSRSEEKAAILEKLLLKQGYQVFRYKAPYDNLSEVGNSLYGAQIVVYFGHGIIRGARLGNVTSTNVGGMMLGTYDLSPKELRREIRFAPGALIFLPSSCFTSGNCVEDSGKVARPVVEKRMYTYAKDFFQCGAERVISNLDPVAYLTEWYESRDEDKAYRKAAYPGKDTTFTLYGLRIQYREPDGLLKPNSTVVKRDMTTR